MLVYKPVLTFLSLTNMLYIKQIDDKILMLTTYHACIISGTRKFYCVQTEI